ncbi:MAG TPA: ABC transporter permease [Acidimicrobiales bacterium]|nr:ABC transporter permease [Acidimicrobiales bacterium]
MIRVEFTKQVRRARTYIALGVLALIPIILTLALKLNPPSPSSNERGYFEVATHSGINVPIAALTAMSAFLLVIVVSLFAGETISGEASWGTLRYLLVRPVSRPRLLATKLLVVSTLSILATIVISVVALVAGVIAFGWHPVITPAFLSVSQGSALGKLALGTLYVAWSMASFVTFAFLWSTITDSAFAAVAAGVGLGIVSQILNNISALDFMSFVFPTHYIDAWHSLFQPTHTGDMVNGFLLEIPYIAVFLSLAWWNFLRKDVVS